MPQGSPGADVDLSIMAGAGTTIESIDIVPQYEHFDQVLTLLSLQGTPALPAVGAGFALQRRAPSSTFRASPSRRTRFLRLSASRFSTMPRPAPSISILVSPSAPRRLPCPRARSSKCWQPSPSLPPGCSCLPASRQSLPAVVGHAPCRHKHLSILPRPHVRQRKRVSAVSRRPAHGLAVPAVATTCSRPFRKTRG